MLLVDHDMGFIFSLCDSITVMNAGRVIADGTPREIESSPAVREAYLGAHGAGLKHEAGLKEAADARTRPGAAA